MGETVQTDSAADDVTVTITGESGEKAANQVENGNDAPDKGEKPAENGDSADETLAEWLDPADSAGNTGSKGENWPDEADLNAKIAKLEAELAESRDQLLRKAADFENFRKRMNQEKQNAIDFANQTLLLDIIPVIDDFERAIQSAESSVELAGLPAGKAMLDGITMIEKRLISQLEGKWGLKRFSSAGEPFDPNRHEAMMMEKSPDVQEPVVQEDFVKGYMLKDRVIRAAKVKVIMPEDT
jgi:molecular chaperone GrpE